MTVAEPFVNCDLIAHRAASFYCPENTLASVRRAAELGAKWIETDVQMTGDGHLIMMHDTSLDRTTNGTGYVAQHSLAEIKALDAGSWFAADAMAENGEPHRVPTLEEFLAEISHYGLNVQVEIKELGGREHELTDLVCAEIERLWTGNPNRLMLSGFSERCIRRAAERLPDVPRAFAQVFVPAEPDVIAEEVGAQIIQVQNLFTDALALERIRASHVEFGVATVNDPERARFLLDEGVQHVMTDRPDIFAKS